MADVPSNVRLICHAGLSQPLHQLGLHRPLAADNETPAMLRSRAQEPQHIREEQRVLLLFDPAYAEHHELGRVVGPRRNLGGELLRIDQGDGDLEQARAAPVAIGKRGSHHYDPKPAAQEPIGPIQEVRGGRERAAPRMPRAGVGRQVLPYPQDYALATQACRRRKDQRERVRSEQPCHVNIWEAPPEPDGRARKGAQEILWLREASVKRQFDQPDVIRDLVMGFAGVGRNPADEEHLVHSFGKAGKKESEGAIRVDALGVTRVGIICVDSHSHAGSLCFPAADTCKVPHIEPDRTPDHPLTVRMPAMATQGSPNKPSWLQPPARQEGLGRYAQVLRERRRVVILAVVLTLLGAGAYLATADNVYEAAADLLVSPASGDDPVLSSLGVIRESSDPTRDVETAARLATTIDVAERAREDFGLEGSGRDLLKVVRAEPIAQSNIVAIVAEGSTREEAQDRANAFAAAAVEQRTASLHEQIEAVLPGLQPELGEDVSAELEAQIARLESLASGPDPTLRVETEASLPTSPVSPRPLLTVAGALLAGLVLGVGAAFTLQALDPLIRRDEQLRSRYDLPILARIPTEPGRSKNTALGPHNLSPPTLEAYRTLRASVTAARRRRGAKSEALLVTGSSPSEGKTTTAINLACSLALAGSKVILIEADLRRPAIARTLGVTAEQGVVSVLLENSRLEDSLVTSPAFGPDLSMLLADYEGSWFSELFSLPAARELVDRAKEHAEYVIIDSPPLTSVIDSLPLAAQADDVLVVTRLGTSRLDKLQELGELLAANDIRPLGFAIMGAPRPSGDSYYHQSPDMPAAGRSAAAAQDGRA